MERAIVSRSTTVNNRSQIMKLRGMSKREKRVVPATTGQREEVDVVVGTERREENGNQYKCVSFSFSFLFFLIRKSNFGSPKIGIPKLPLV